MSKIITLSNGKKIANFSSPHSFIFTDGTELPAVDKDKANLLKINFIEKELGNGDIELSFELTDAVRSAIVDYNQLYVEGAVDVVFCPLPMLTAMKAEGYDILNSPFRSIRIEDRINKLVSIEKQCL